MPPFYALAEVKGSLNMHEFSASLLDGVQVYGDLPADVRAYLTHHNCPRTLEHSQQVAAEARQLARRFGADPEAAEAAGWLQDVSAVIPSSQRLDAARLLGLPVLSEEEALRMILHQRLSGAIAREGFGVSDAAILAAVRCHTTLKARAAALDKVVFLADKMRSDQPYAAPFLDGVLAGLQCSLDRGRWPTLSTSGRKGAHCRWFIPGSWRRIKDCRAASHRRLTACCAARLEVRLCCGRRTLARSSAAACPKRMRDVA